MLVDNTTTFEPDMAQQQNVSLVHGLLVMDYENTTLAPEPSEPEYRAPSCAGPTPAQLQLYVAVSWWLEGVIQITLGCFGFVANAVAIPILLSKEMSSIFNRLVWQK